MSSPTFPVCIRPNVLPYKHCWLTEDDVDASIQFHIYHTAWTSLLLLPRLITTWDPRMREEPARLSTRPQTSIHGDFQVRESRSFWFLTLLHRHVGHRPVNSATSHIQIASFLCFYSSPTSDTSCPQLGLLQWNIIEDSVSGIPDLTIHNLFPTPMLEWSFKPWSRILVSCTKASSVLQSEENPDCLPALSQSGPIHISGLVSFHSAKFSHLGSLSIPQANQLALSLTLWTHTHPGNLHCLSPVTERVRDQK